MQKSCQAFLEALLTVLLRGGVVLQCASQQAPRVVSAEVKYFKVDDLNTLGQAFRRTLQPFGGSVTERETQVPGIFDFRPCPL